MTMLPTTPEHILPKSPDKALWTDREKMAYAWLLDRVAGDALNEALEELELDEESEEKIRTAATIGRTGLIGYVRELTGFELSSEEFAQVMWEIGLAAQEIDKQDNKEV